MLLQVVTAYYSLDGAEILGFVCAVVMSAVNITLDLIVGLVLHGSLFGIGLATSVSYLLALMSLGLYFRKKDRLFRFVSVKNSAAKTLSMIYTGLPSAVNRVCFCSTSVILNHMLTAAAGEMGSCRFFRSEYGGNLCRCGAYGSYLYHCGVQRHVLRRAR